MGSSFTTNTATLAQAPGSFIASTDDFRQVEYGLKMLCAATKLRVARCLVLQGKERKDVAMPLLGMQFRFVPAKDFLDEYQKTPVDDRVRAMAAGGCVVSVMAKFDNVQDVLDFPGFQPTVLLRRLQAAVEAVLPGDRAGGHGRLRAGKIPGRAAFGRLRSW